MDQFSPAILQSACVATLLAALFAVLRALLLRRVGPAAPTLAVFFGVFFIGLTMFPMPDRAAVSCPVPGTEPNLLPFFFLRTTLQHIQWFGFDLRRTLLSTHNVSTLLNILACMPIGFFALRARPPGRWLYAIFLIPFAVEFTQATAFWGHFPCPVRQFDVDDLMTNAAGLWLGLRLARRFDRRRGGESSDQVGRGSKNNL